MLKLAEDKSALIVELGGKCEQCGLADVRALDINHKDRTAKTRYRSYTLERRLKDWRKNKATLQLLCANCHRIHTHETAWKEQRKRF
jgi:ribosomal protein L44E